MLSYHEIERISFLQTPNIFICVASDPLDLISEGKVMRRLVAHVIFTQYQDWKGAPSSYILYGFQTRKRNYFCHMQSLKGSNLTTCNLCTACTYLHCIVKLWVEIVSDGGYLFQITIEQNRRKYWQFYSKILFQQQCKKNTNFPSKMNSIHCNWLTVTATLPYNPRFSL